MPRVVDAGSTPELQIVMPQGEELERAMRDGLHSIGDARTVEQEAQYRALVAKHGDPDCGIGVFSEYLRLDALGVTRTPEQDERHRELGARFGFDGAGLTPEKLDDLEHRVQAGEELTAADAIAYDAAIRQSRSMNRPDRRDLRGRVLRERLFRRRLARPNRARATGARTRRSTLRRAARTSRGSPSRSTEGDDEPSPALAGRRRP
jgi:hypothetical protein